MNTIQERLEYIKSSLPEEVSLVAVSKYHTTEDILAAYDAGQRIFGESHAQEITKKSFLLPKDIIWHFIGHLQTNKVKFIAPYINMIESVDSLHLMKEINDQALRCQRTINILLELHVAEEETKYGLSLNECRQLLSDGEWRNMTNITICGLMMMASQTDDEEQIEKEFLTAADFFDEVKNKYFADDERFCERSWGMSSDYHIALRCRSTLVRVGTAIFGERDYN